MKLIKVTSSMNYAVGYDEDTCALDVVFRRSGVYRHLDVPREVYEGLLVANSKGRYMLARVIDVYHYVKWRCPTAGRSAVPPSSWASGPRWSPPMRTMPISGGNVGVGRGGETPDPKAPKGLGDP